MKMSLHHKILYSSAPTEEQCAKSLMTQLATDLQTMTAREKL